MSETKETEAPVDPETIVIDDNKEVFEKPVEGVEEITELETPSNPEAEKPADAALPPDEPATTIAEENHLTATDKKKQAAEKKRKDKQRAARAGKSRSRKAVREENKVNLPDWYEAQQKAAIVETVPEPESVANFRDHNLFRQKPVKGDVSAAHAHLVAGEHLEHVEGADD